MSVTLFSKNLDPFIFDKTNNHFYFTVDNKIDVHATFPKGLLVAEQVVKCINHEIHFLNVPNVAETDGYGRVLLRSWSNGVDQEIRIWARDHNANQTLGFTPGIYVSDNPAKNRLYFCPYCGQPFPTLVEAKNHEANCPSKNETSAPAIIKSKKEYTECPICGEKLERGRDEIDGRFVCWRGCWKEPLD